jgi:hypothetical protein
MTRQHIIKKYKEFRDHYFNIHSKWLQAKSLVDELDSELNSNLKESREEFFKLFADLEKKASNIEYEYDEYDEYDEDWDNPGCSYILDFKINDKGGALDIIEDIILIFEDLSFHNIDVKLELFITIDLVQRNRRSISYFSSRLVNQGVPQQDSMYSNGLSKSGQYLLGFEIYLPDLETNSHCSPSEILSYLNRYESIIENDDK